MSQSQSNNLILALFLCKKILERSGKYMELVEKFKRFLKEDGKSPKTIESYALEILKAL